MKKYILFSTTLFSIFTVASFLTPENTFAQKPLKNQRLEIIPHEKTESFRQGDMRVDKNNGVPVALYRLHFQVRQDKPESMARQFLLDHAKRLRLLDDLSDLVHFVTRETPGGYHVRFLQFCGGYPVYKAEIVVTINHQDFVTFIMNHYKPEVKLPSSKLMKPAAAARQIAYNYLGIQGTVNFEKNQTLVYHNKGRQRLAYQIITIPTESSVGDWEILVDAYSGEIFRAEDRALYHQRTETQPQLNNGTGWVFDPDPLTRSGKSYGDAGFTDGNDTNTVALNAQRIQRTLHDITFDGSLYHLEGPYAAIKDFEAPFHGLFSQPTNDFDFTRTQQGFEAVNVYYHVDQSMRYINETLEFNLMPFQYTGGVQVDPHGLEGDDNSYYLPATGQIAWGEGGTDDAEDPDVILHELGHGLHDWLTHGQISQVEGLSEGSGDYWAKSYQRGLEFWQPTEPQYHWLFHWDGHNEFWSGRITNYDARYPEGLIDQIHIDGQIWSSTLMQIYEDIGKQATDANFLEALSMLNSSSNQEDAAQAFIQADIALHQGVNLNTILFWFQQRGYNVTIPPQPGRITISPLSLNAKLSFGKTATQSLMISNSNSEGSLLNYKIKRQNARINWEDISDIQKRSKINDIGGPDEFGYTWLDSDALTGPIFHWRDISTTGTKIFLDDDEDILLALPFPFPFYGENKDSIRVSSNGYLTFGTDGTEFENNHIPDNTQPNDCIMPFWDDLNPEEGGTIHYATVGTDSFIVQYTDIVSFTNSSNYTFQVICHRGGNIVFQYLNMPGEVEEATVGIENSSGTDGLEIVSNRRFLHDTLAIKILAPQFWLHALPVVGALAANETDHITVTFDATKLKKGTYNATLQVMSNDSTNALVHIPVSINIEDSTSPKFRYEFPISGWYLISLPVLPNNLSLNALFPNAQAAFGWNLANKQFFEVTTLQPENAYWLFITEPGHVDILGQPLNSFSRKYSEQGWDMIGAMNQVKTVVDNPAGSVIQMFRWDVVSGDYVSVSPFLAVPGEGYWILPFTVPSTVTIGDTLANHKRYRTLVHNDDASIFPPLPPSHLLETNLQATPKHFTLSQNYPNPFNPTTIIEYQLPQISNVRLEIYTILGQTVTTLVDAPQKAGSHRIIWNSKDRRGNDVDSGVYFYRIQAEGFTETRKLLLLR